MRRKIVWIIWECELSEPILRYLFISGRELWPEQACELSDVRISKGQIIRATLYI